MEKLFNLNCSIEKNPKFELIMSLEEELRWQLGLYEVLPAADDHQFFTCVEKQHVAPTGKQSVALLKTYFSFLKYIYMFKFTLHFGRQVAKV